MGTPQERHRPIKAPTMPPPPAGDLLCLAITPGHGIMLCHADSEATLVYHQLRSSETCPAAATLLLDRLRLGLEDEEGTRRLLRALQRLMPPGPCHPTVSEQVGGPIHGALVTKRS